MWPVRGHAWPGTVGSAYDAGRLRRAALEHVSTQSPTVLPATIPAHPRRNDTSGQDMLTAVGCTAISLGAIMQGKSLVGGQDPPVELRLPPGVRAPIKLALIGALAKDIPQAGNTLETALNFAVDPPFCPHGSAKSPTADKPR